MWGRERGQRQLLHTAFDVASNNWKRNNWRKRWQNISAVTPFLLPPSPPPLPLSLSLLHTHTHTLSLSLTYTHTHTFSLSYIHTHTHFLSLLHTHTHTLSLSLTYTHYQPFPVSGMTSTTLRYSDTSWWEKQQDSECLSVCLCV